MMLVPGKEVERLQRCYLRTLGAVPVLPIHESWRSAYHFDHRHMRHETAAAKTILCTLFEYGRLLSSRILSRGVQLPYSGRFASSLYNYYIEKCPRLPLRNVENILQITKVPM